MVQLAFFAFLRSKAYTFSSLHSCHYYDIFMQNILENELSLMTSQSKFLRILRTPVSDSEKLIVFTRGPPVFVFLNTVVLIKLINFYADLRKVFEGSKRFMRSIKA